MKKNYSVFVMMAMLLMTCMSFVACGGNDEEETISPGGVSDVININGTDYRMSREVTWEGEWKNGKGTFYVPVLDRVGNADDVLLYQFKFKSSAQPKVGDEFSKMALTLVPLDNNGYNYMLDGELPYISGTAKVVSLDNSENYTITVAFDHLTMGNSKATYVFNGTTWLDFNFAR